MNVVLTSIDLRAPIAALVAIGLMALGLRVYLRWATQADQRRALAVERALEARAAPTTARADSPDSTP